MYRNARHDSFHRELAEALAQGHPNPSPGVSSAAEESGKESPFNWMRRGLARVRRQSS
jgi:hypothetical protein